MLKKGEGVAAHHKIALVLPEHQADDGGLGNGLVNAITNGAVVGRFENLGGKTRTVVVVDGENARLLLW